MIALAELAVYGTAASGNDAVQPLYVGPTLNCNQTMTACMVAPINKDQAKMLTTRSCP